MSTLILTPSYGRDYKSKTAVLEAWNGDKDFTIRGMGPDAGRQINKEDADANSVTEVNIRYNQSRSVAVLYKNAKGEWKAR